MIKYSLSCANGHAFEGWFQSIAAFDHQVEEGQVRCPTCGSAEVSKAVMAPNVALRSLEASQQEVDRRQVADLMEALRERIEGTADYVGPDFAEEARRLHYEEAPDRPIYGEATRGEARELIEEGIGILPLPAARKRRN
jgi:hypothetical protein